MTVQRTRRSRPRDPRAPQNAARLAARPSSGAAAAERGRLEAGPDSSWNRRMERADRLGHDLTRGPFQGPEAIQRAVIPVYLRNPPTDEARIEDRSQVDRFAVNSSQGPNAGAVRAELPAGGDLRGVADTEKVIVTGHGNVGTIQGYSGEEVATYLKTSWHLPRTYPGDILLSSCKAGDAGFFSFLNPSLVQSVSDGLLGYQATVVGLKGNVVTGSAESSAPGVARSVGDDRAFERWKALERTYRETIAARDKAFEDRAGLDVVVKRAAELKIQGLRWEQSQLERARRAESAVSSVVSSVSAFFAGGDRSAEIDREIEQEQVKIARAEGVISRATAEVAEAFRDRIAELRHDLDDAGRPLGTAGITVRYTPVDRDTLGNQWVDFLLRESAEGQASGSGGPVVQTS